MGENLSFPTADTRLFDDEDTWKACTLANSTVIGTEFDSTPDEEKPAKGGRYFASDSACTDRYKVIFKPWAFEKPAKRTLCDGNPIDTTGGKKCKKTCKNNVECRGFQISGKGQQKSCTFYGKDIALGAAGTKFDKCILSKPPKKAVLGE